MTQHATYVTLAGRPLRHLTGSEMPEDLVDDAQLGLTCRRADRAWARSIAAQAANQRFDSPVYKAKTVQSPVEDISIVYVELRDDVDEQTRKMLEAETNARIEAVL